MIARCGNWKGDRKVGMTATVAKRAIAGKRKGDRGCVVWEWSDRDRSTIVG